MDVLARVRFLGHGCDQNILRRPSTKSELRESRLYSGESGKGKYVHISIFHLIDLLVVCRYASYSVQSWNRQEPNPPNRVIM